MKRFKIGHKEVGEGCEPFIIAEIAQAHDGSLGIAHSFIDLVAETGADAVKFQTHITEAETTKEEPWRVKFSYEDDTRWDYWKRMEFSPSQWAALASHARERGLIFLSSPFSIEAVELLDSLGMPAWKIASGEITNLPMINRICQTGQPVLLSNGLGSDDEIKELVTMLQKRDIPVCLFECTTEYPCSPETMDLSRIGRLKSAYELPIGLSDHSGEVYPAIASVALGASMIEVHLAFNKKMFGPDAKASLESEELKDLVRACKKTFIASQVKNPSEEFKEKQQVLRRTFMKSIYAGKDLQKGDFLSAENLVVRKPGTGISAFHFEEMLGKKIVRAVPAGTMLAKEDLDI